MYNEIEVKSEQLAKICKNYSVKSLFLFGSALNSDFDGESDLDFAVIFKSSLSPIERGNSFFQLLFELEQLFSRKVDLVSYSVLKNPVFKSEIDKTKRLLYAA